MERHRRVAILLICLALLLGTTGCNIVKGGEFIPESYEGPVFTLSTLSDTKGITVERNISYDFSDYDFENYGVTNYDFVNDGYHTFAYRKAVVDDNYILTNTTDEDISIQVVYSFTGNLKTDIETMPVITVNKELADVKSVLGRTSFRYVDILEENGVENANDVSSLHNRQCYELLFSDGTYMRETLEAMENPPELTQTVKVYKFEDVGYDGQNEEIKYPSAEVFYKAESDKTLVLTYGINTFGSKDGMENLGFYVPVKSDEDFGKDVYLIVVNGDIDIQETRCYQNQSMSHVNRTDEFSVKLKQYDSTLEEVMWEILYENRQVNHVPLTISDVISNELFLDASKQFLYDTDIIHDTMIAPLDGSVFDVISCEYGVLFQSLDVTVPANSSIEINAAFKKPASLIGADGNTYDYYDIMIEPNSNLEFSSQMLTVIGADDVVIAEQTSGEELENGKSEIKLEDSYFEIYIDEP